MTKAMRHLGIGAVGLLAAASVLVGQAAPAPTDPALTVDKQIHLGSYGALVKEGNLFLWGGNTNTGVGQNALSSTTGSSNAALGSNALSSNTTGSFNTAVGDIALASNQSGERNTAVGGFALTRNISGSFNTALGLAAMEYNTTGHDNTAVGHAALAVNLGEMEPYDNLGSFNTALGGFALGSNTYGSSNTAVGYNALRSNSTGNSNVAVGRDALRGNTNGYGNTAVGLQALANGLTARNSTAVGQLALSSSSGTRNVGVGFNALGSTTYGNENTAVGYDALFGNSIGNRNVALGIGAGFNATTGNDNIFILNNGDGADTNTIRIGTAFNSQGDADPTNDTGQMKTFVAGIQEQTLSLSAVPVCVEPTGQLGKCTDPVFRSSRRYKTEIRDVGSVGERLEGLRPVTFRFKEEVAGTRQDLEYGLIAEEVAEVFPELVVYDDEGRPETVKYRLLSSILLAEVQRQAADLSDLRARLKAIERKLQ